MESDIVNRIIKSMEKMVEKTMVTALTEDVELLSNPLNESGELKGSTARRKVAAKRAVDYLILKKRHNDVILTEALTSLIDGNKTLQDYLTEEEIKNEFINGNPTPMVSVRDSLVKEIIDLENIPEQWESNKEYLIPFLTDAISNLEDTIAMSSSMARMPGIGKKIKATINDSKKKLENTKKAIAIIESLI